MIPETINWIPASSPPEDDRTVLLFNPDAGETVWLGYLDADGWWYVDGRRADPMHWANRPEGPKQ